MNITFKIHNKQKESLSNAIVILRISDQEEYTLPYNSELGVFAKNLELASEESDGRTAKHGNVKRQGDHRYITEGFLVTAVVSCAGYEPVTFKQRLTENEMEVCLGETGTKYARTGYSMQPVQEHLDVIGVGWCTDEGVAALRKQGLEPGFSNRNLPTLLQA